MPRFLIAIHHPHDYNPESEDEAMCRAIDGLNDEMVAAGVRIFVGGLHPAKKAKSVRAKDGQPIVTDGPYLKTPEHVGGLWVVEAANMEEAVRWAKKATIACRAPVEVREFH